MNANSHGPSSSTTSPQGAAPSNSRVEFHSARTFLSLHQAAGQFKRHLHKHATGITFTPFAAVGGLLYAASIVGPLHTGFKNNLADHSARRRQDALKRHDNHPSDYPSYRPQSSLGSLVSVAKEFAAPLTWAVKGYRTGYNFVQ